MIDMLNSSLLVQVSSFTSAAAARSSSARFAAAAASERMREAMHASAGAVLFQTPSLAFRGFVWAELLLTRTHAPIDARTSNKQSSHDLSRKWIDIIK